VNLKARRQHELLTRVHAFGEAHATTFPPGTVGAQMFATVARCLQEAAEQAAATVAAHGHGRHVTTSKTTARLALRRSLEAIRRTARALAIDSRGLDRPFRLPRSSSEQRLLFASRGMARSAARSKATFIRYGMPAAFLDELTARIDEFDRAIRARGGARAKRVRAKVRLDAALNEGMMATRRLDAVVFNALGSDPSAMALWETARCVARSVKRANGLVSARSVTRH
jgi:hypothetical protein